MIINMCLTLNGHLLLAGSIGPDMRLNICLICHIKFWNYMVAHPSSKDTIDDSSLFTQTPPQK